MSKKINYQLRLNNLNFMLGYLLSDQNRNPINILLILAKNIFLTLLKNNTVMCLDRLMHKFKNTYAEEKFMANLQDKEAFLT